MASAADAPADGAAAAAAAAADDGVPLALTDEVKQQFDEKLLLTAIRVPKQATSQYMRRLSKHLFNKPRLLNVIKDPTDDDSRLLLLDEGLAEADLASRQLAGEPACSIAELVAAEGLAVTTATMQVGYSYWPASTVLQRLLPEGLEVPSSFETVGHIAHLNLRKELLPYKRLIGQVILDKNPSLRTVVNKVATIENEFRVFPMELLAGAEGTETEVRQHGARFRLDFAKVYWNSRLEREHQRLVERFAPGEVVVDAMAGIGPFAIPAAAKGCLVYANDLNPASYEYLCINIGINRLGGKVLPFCADGRAFMRQAAAGQLDLTAAAVVVPPPKPTKPKEKGSKGQQQQQQPAAGQQQQQTAQQQTAEQQQEGAAAAAVAAAAAPNGTTSRCFQHLVMNLPAAAVEFLDALPGAFSPELWAGQQLPLVHVYTFAKGEDELAGLRRRVEASLGGQLEEEPEVTVIRDVAPQKVFCCVTFRLPASIAFAEPAKRQRVQ
ncbi:tRNA (guanine(37)-N1)-methyltransferase 1 [Micractinium conductrix]|uniref:tRNA (guanine(37)-N1)-methyltransferase n=1 Tax=Micractinium conductrix TaxID=554055 RepID=A0A2P6VGQ2_9CHLO|nr:tRNA (guanine(37)-N1)-methyltransferase 1 [Micractinium conductrix]|eukprot:PSC73269.1 tRNA (guanine(37)-N1)-methyltransferase 1 [Micractinium conductrix]